MNDSIEMTAHMGMTSHSLPQWMLSATWTQPKSFWKMLVEIFMETTLARLENLPINIIHFQYFQAKNQAGWGKMSNSSK
jgi:hypothetical protein